MHPTRLLSEFGTFLTHVKPHLMELPEHDRQAVASALRLAEGFLINIARIADAIEKQGKK